MEKSHEYFFFIFVILIGIFFYFLIVYYTPFAGKAMGAETYVRIDPGIKVLYYTFNGSTTNFLYYNDAELGAIENTTLERTVYGKIVFDGLVDLASDADASRVINLDRNVNISHNWIQINTTRLNSLRGSAVLQLNNLEFQDPQIMVGGSVCPSSICQMVSYYNGTIEFNVSQFTMDAYWVDETPDKPPEEPIPSPGGGGGGGRGGPPKKPRNVTKKILLELDAPISQTLFAGDEKKILITMKNKGDLELLDTVVYTTTNAKHISLGLSEDYFESLDVGEEDSLVLKIKSLVESTAHIGIDNYIITVTADVGNYEYSSSIRFFINIRERDYEERLQTLKQLEFADDFISNMPDCSEIVENIKKAWDLYNVSKYNETISIIDSAMQGCREIIGVSEEELKRIEQLAPEKKDDIFLFFIGMILLLILFSGILAYYRWRMDKKARTAKDLPVYYRVTSEQEEVSDLHLKFERHFRETWDFIRGKDFVNAKKGYVNLFKLYKTLKASGAEDSVKIECYHKLREMYSELSELKKE